LSTPNSVHRFVSERRRQPSQEQPHRWAEATTPDVRAVYVDHHGTAALHNPTAEEWAEFQAGCSMRDIGTHLCFSRSRFRTMVNVSECCCDRVSVTLTAAMRAV
jgi:hypothetical protein